VAAESLDFLLIIQALALAGAQLARLNFIQCGLSGGNMMDIISD
jgi:hypothetical protein